MLDPAAILLIECDAANPGFTTKATSVPALVKSVIKLDALRSTSCISPVAVLRDII